MIVYRYVFMSQRKVKIEEMHISRISTENRRTRTGGWFYIKETDSFEVCIGANVCFNPPFINCFTSNKKLSKKQIEKVRGF